MLLDARQGDETRSNAATVLEQSGQRLPDGLSDLFQVTKRQSTRTECEIINVEWISLPSGKEMVPIMEVEPLHFPQSLSLRDRQSLSTCDRGTYRADPTEFLYFGFVVLGVSANGTIRGIEVGNDPRVVIVECPELFGGKSTPQTRCGHFIKRRILVDVRMPRDPELSHLTFYVRRFTSLREWHLERVGSIDLPH
jgi:hypothetical protein